MTVNSELVLNYLKSEFGKEHTKQEIAQTLGISLPAVTGTVNSLRNKGYISERVEEVELEPATETRKAKMQTIRYETLTEAGLAYDPVAEAEEKAAAKAAEKEAKAAARAAAKAAKEEA